MTDERVIEIVRQWLAQSLLLQEEQGLETLITARKVAEIIGVSENYIYDLAANGSLPSYKINGTRRFRPSEVQTWLETQRA